MESILLKPLGLNMILRPGAFVFLAYAGLALLFRTLSVKNADHYLGRVPAAPTCRSA